MLQGAACRPCRKLFRPLRLFNCEGLRTLTQLSSATRNPPEVFSNEALQSAANADAHFEVIGSSSSLLSVTVSPSQALYTRRGSLVAVSGKAENASSTLSFLEPFRRALLRIPFLYQHITSTSPVKALISTRSSNTSMTVVHLDGTVDWTMLGRSLLAWSGHRLVLTPAMMTILPFAYWGTTLATGRGLLGLIGHGSILQVQLNPGETYIAHPSHVIAYSASATQPSTYQLRSSAWQLQVPSISTFIPDTRFFRAVRESGTWKTLLHLFHTMRTWVKRRIWGERLFIKFEGPSTVLLQSRSWRAHEGSNFEDLANNSGGLNDKSTNEEASDGAILQPASLQRRLQPSRKEKAPQTGKISFASVLPNGRVEIKSQ